MEKQQSLELLVQQAVARRAALLQEAKALEEAIKVWLPKKEGKEDAAEPQNPEG